MIEPPIPCAPTSEHEKMCLLMTDKDLFGQVNFILNTYFNKHYKKILIKKNFFLNQCLAFVDPAPFIDRCLESLCLNGHICNSLESFSQACRDVGICVNWRSNEFCPFTCPSGLRIRDIIFTNFV